MELKEFLEKTYEEINENIKFSEAKNAALITLNSALISASATKVFDKDITFCWRALIAFITLSLLLPLLISIFSFRANTGFEKGLVAKIYSFISEKNITPSEPKKLMYFSYINSHYKDDKTDNKENKTAAEKYFEDIKLTFGSTIKSQCPTCESSQKDEVIPFESPEGQLASQIVDLSSVAYRKFSLFNFAMLCQTIIFVLGGISAFLIVIIKVACHTI